MPKCEVVHQKDHKRRYVPRQDHKEDGDWAEAKTDGPKLDLSLIDSGQVIGLGKQQGIEPTDNILKVQSKCIPTENIPALFDVRTHGTSTCDLIEPTNKQYRGEQGKTLDEHQDEKKHDKPKGLSFAKPCQITGAGKQLNVAPTDTTQKAAPEETICDERRPTVKSSKKGKCCKSQCLKRHNKGEKIFYTEKEYSEVKMKTLDCHLGMPLLILLVTKWMADGPIILQF
ncbi:uncharacterized protein [Ambystoma mexicanum]|uniref:uncharacterized protein n=1 Tax=Ambystoma mexicanum TaxID=8296 RepID=UPI0037E86219